MGNELILNCNCVNDTEDQLFTMEVIIVAGDVFYHLIMGVIDVLYRSSDPAFGHKEESDKKGLVSSF